MTDDATDGSGVDDASIGSGSDEATDVEAAVEQFLDSADSALSEYEQGYADADATLSVLESHIEELRDAIGEDETE